uniref:Glycoprotein hormone subunit beta domain-containing protein n=1 Tax=Trichuris muris TaxID=70415 RepID=A0A5S6Q0S9_TRIMR
MEAIVQVRCLNSPNNARRSLYQLLIRSFGTFNHIDFRLLPIVLSLLQNIHCCEAKRSHVPFLHCGLSLYTFNATVTDEQGRSCAQEIRTTACLGTCESYEISDFDYPGSSIFKYSQCDFGRVRQRTTFLVNCDEGINPEVQLYRYMEAVSCHCQSCLSFDIECMVRLTRRRLLSYSPNSILQLLKLPKSERPRKLIPCPRDALAKVRQPMIANFP